MPGKINKELVLRTCVSLLMIVFVMQFISCGSDTERQAPGEQIETFDIVNPELESNRRLWTEKKIYSYNMQVSFYTAGLYAWADPVLIQVRNGEVVEISKVDASDPKGTDGFAKIATVNKMFDFIDREVKTKAKILKSEYDQTYGYPKDVHISNPKKGVDAVYEIIIREFEVVD